MREKPPVMIVGRYAGTPVDRLPNSYLRWIIGQDFPKIILDAAKKKLEQSDYNDLYLNVTRHAVDMFSKRFLYLWNEHIRKQGDKGDGLATFIVKQAQEAWENGTDISKHRHQDDGTVKLYKQIKWVFAVNSNFPDYRDLVTVMVSDDH